MYLQYVQDEFKELKSDLHVKCNSLCMQISLIKTILAQYDEFFIT